MGFDPEKLRLARKAAGLSRDRLAADADISSATVGLLERGSVDPRSETVAKLANALGIDPGSLFADPTEAAS